MVPRLICLWKLTRDQEHDKKAHFNVCLFVFFSGPLPFKFPLLFDLTSPWYSSQYNKARKRNKTHLIEKEEIKLALFSEDMIVYVENLMDSYKKQLELVSLARLRIQEQYAKK